MVRREGFSIQPTLLTPSSRGHIRLNNTDPLSEPLIDPNYLGHPDDVNIMLEGKHTLVALFGIKCFFIVSVPCHFYHLFRNTHSHYTHAECIYTSASNSRPKVFIHNTCTDMNFICFSKCNLRKMFPLMSWSSKHLPNHSYIATIQVMSCMNLRLVITLRHVSSKENI